jgi:hypothetical protein
VVPPLLPEPELLLEPEPMLPELEPEPMLPLDEPEPMSLPLEVPELMPLLLVLFLFFLWCFLVVVPFWSVLVVDCPDWPMVSVLPDWLPMVLPD